MNISCPMHDLVFQVEMYLLCVYLYNLVSSIVLVKLIYKNTAAMHSMWYYMSTFLKIKEKNFHKCWHKIRHIRKSWNTFWFCYLLLFGMSVWLYTVNPAKILLVCRLFGSANWKVPFVFRGCKVNYKINNWGLIAYINSRWILFSVWILFSKYCFKCSLQWCCMM